MGGEYVVFGIASISWGGAQCGVRVPRMVRLRPWSDIVKDQEAARKAGGSASDFGADQTGGAV